MAKIIGLPKLSPTMEEGTLVRWVKQEGEAIDVDDLVAEVETDKATMEFRSFDRGVLLKQLAAEGTTLEPDQPVAIMGEANEDISALVAQVGKGPAEPAAVETAPVRAEQPSTGSASESIGEASGNGRVLASPLVRKLAREMGLELRAIRGSGPNGRVIKRDLEEVASAGPPGAAVRGPSVKPASGPTARPASGLTRVASTPSGGEGRAERLSQMRRTIARRLTESKQNVPHFYLNIDVDAEALVQARGELNAQLAAQGEKVSLNDLVIKASALALRQVPECNASFRGDSILYHDRVDISVAVAVPDGLVTPVVRGADNLGVLEISRVVRDLAVRARDKKLRPEEMSDGTFSVSNLGMFGIDEFSAVINPPEGAILAVSAVREEPVVKAGSVVAGKRMALTLSCDHRVIDGAVGARWLQALRMLLQSPLRMLL